MTVFGVLRGFTFLARDVFEAALYLIPAPGLSGDDVDGAEQLAEKEAAEDVTEPMDCGLGGDFPPAAGDAPTPPDHPSYPQTNGLNTESQQERDDLVKKLTKQAYWSSPWMKHYQTADSQRLDKITVLLEDIRNLLHHNAPVASASSPTPADATGLTLANDPHSVHQRHMRRLLGEDK